MKNINLNNDELLHILIAINSFRDGLDKELDKEFKQTKLRKDVIKTLTEVDKEYEELRTKILKEMD